MLTDVQKLKFGNDFVERYLSHGFGSMTKSEIDILVFHLISEAEEIKDESNYKVANKLQITESKVKSLRLNSSLKYKPANHRAVLGNIVTRIIDEMQKPEFESGQVTITLENPVDQREFEHAVKLAHRNIEYGMNRELLKVKPIALFEIVMANLENAEQEITSIVQAHITDNEKQAEILSSALTLRQKINKIGEEISAKSGLIALLTSASTALV
jgi:hypothetical protein